jgi:hypothetical protein
MAVAKQQRTATDQNCTAESCLDILVHTEVIAYLAQPHKLRLQETCRGLCNRLHSDAAWRELDLTHTTYTVDGNTAGVLYGRLPGPEQLAISRAVIKQPKYRAVYSVHLNGVIVGSQSTSTSSRKSKAKLDNYLVAELCDCYLMCVV